MKRIALVSFVLSAGGLSGTLLAAGAERPPARVGEQAPKVAVDTLEGKRVELSELVAGKPTLLFFWATWCPNCREQLPRFKEAFERFAPKGLNMLAIDTGVRDSVGAVKRYVTENSLPYRVLFDTRQEGVRAYGVATTPTILLIDRRGIVVDWTHSLDFAAIEAVLAGRPVPQRTPEPEAPPSGRSTRNGSGG